MANDTDGQTTDTGGSLELLEHAPEQRPLLEEVLEGLTAHAKSLPAKLHYDQRGSELFEQICLLDAYDLTRRELSIMHDHADAIARALGPRCMVIEPGSGASLKTRLLLDALRDPAAYVPVEISRGFLIHVAEKIAADHEDIEVLPVWADFTRSHPVPEPDADVGNRAVYFPGSTIGNFSRDEARALLERFGAMAGPGGSVVIGIDLEKDVDAMESAYNDPEGVTAEFNYNVLDHVSRELSAEMSEPFDRARFDFRADWEPEVGAIVSRLWVTESFSLSIGGREIPFERGEGVRMEESHKYTREGFAKLAGRAGLRVREEWADEHDGFVVTHLKRE